MPIKNGTYNADIMPWQLYVRMQEILLYSKKKEPAYMCMRTWVFDFVGPVYIETTASTIFYLAVMLLPVMLAHSFVPRFRYIIVRKLITLVALVWSPNPGIQDPGSRSRRRIIISVLIVFTLFLSFKKEVQTRFEVGWVIQLNIQWTCQLITTGH